MTRFDVECHKPRRGCRGGSLPVHKLEPRPQATGSLAALEIEQRLFDRQPAAVAGERSVAADDAVTRNDDRDRIGSVGETDGAHRFGIADAPRELSVAGGLAVRDIAQRAPHLLLKRRALRRERNIKRAELAGEVRRSVATRCP